MIGILVKIIICRILARVILNLKLYKTYKIDECLNTKYCSCGKRIIGKLVLECEDEILNTNGTLINDKKKVACGIGNCLIHTISLIIICLLLLVVICISYYTKYRSKTLITTSQHHH